MADRGAGDPPEGARRVRVVRRPPADPEAFRPAEVPDAAVVRRRFERAVWSYNRRSFLESQELFERVWAESPEEDRPFVRCLVMLACSMHIHFERGGGQGVLNLLRQILVQLDDFRPGRLGVDVDQLCEALEAWYRDLESRRRPGARFVDRWLMPRIPLR